jgi:hypothetical protein
MVILRTMSVFTELHHLDFVAFRRLCLSRTSVLYLQICRYICKIHIEENVRSRTHIHVDHLAPKAFKIL